MLDNEKLDVVHICTQHFFLHYEMVIESLKRNINLFVEIPLAISNLNFKK